ncbi:Fanconi anemia group D2 protein isoform X3 [Vespa velutina]|uniref:Fanconi anemia group D2 protein isoform X3 n=1 Tax=Vespa velutina TaxID=202808 RepID=UPI001FB40D6C|nr:Fanconi anemia group D2 protein isoform X3 [Vespa velutina]
MTMDKRKIRLKSTLHKNLNHNSSQGSISNLTNEDDLTNKELTSRKRKLPVLDIVKSRSRNDSNLYLSQNEITKKRRSEVNLTQEITKLSQYENYSKIIGISSQKITSNICKTPLKAKKTSNVSEKDNDNIAEAEKSRNTQENISNIQTTQKTKIFVDFLKKCGITLVSDGTYIFNEEVTTIKQKMKENIQSKEYKKQEIINSLEGYIDNQENLQSILCDFEISSDFKSFDHISNTCIVRILLQVSELQPDIYVYFLNKLNESVLLAESIEKIPWARTLLQKFRFLEIIIEPDELTKCLEQLLETCPLWFQRELILCIPDIITEVQHQPIAEILNKLMDDNNELIDTVLDCINNLTLGREYLNDYKQKVLEMLNKHLKTNVIPAITKFILSDCTSMEAYKNILCVLRNLDMQPLHGEQHEDCYKNQMIMIQNIKMSILLSKNMVCASLMIIKKVIKDPKPMDIILLLLISSTGSSRRKSVDAILKQHVRSGFYRLSLLQLLYNNYKEVVRHLQSSVIQLASNLLKVEERIYVDFAIEWFRLQFLSQKDTVHKQREIIEKIILLMGNNDQTAKNALKVLCKMAMGTEEKEYLYAHCNHLRILLEKIDHFDIEEVGTLNDLLHSLCTSTLAESLRDDLFIVLQKQLSAIKPLIKCKGVLGAVMAIKHLACKPDTHTSARNLFKKVLTAVKSCPRSQALFYDQLAQVISQTKNIHEEFLRCVTIYIQDELINTYMVNKSDYNGELIPKFGLNNVEDEPQNLVLNFSNRKYGAIVPITFRLLKTCCMKLSENGDLEDIDSLLGCSILMPENFDIPEPFIIDLVVSCINWFREVISGFVTQSQSLLQKQVLTRLNDLMLLQGELSTMLSLCDPKYQPSPCYFHYFPPPPFLKVEKTIRKKGKKKSLEKSVNTCSQESWEIGSILCSKNPAYFRKLDAKIIHLLDFKLDLNASPTTQSISISQVCFIVKELLGMFENDLNETFLKDIIYLLPKICGKLQEIVIELREEDADEKREGARLILCLLATVFNWKEFHSAIYNPMLREGLRILASQQNDTNAMLRSCKELVTESCKYIESLSDIATRISISVALITMYQSVMKHSESYMQQHKDKNAKMALGFLSLDWSKDKQASTSYKVAVNTLIKSWIDYELSPLDTITMLLEWLPSEVIKLEKSHNYLDRLPSINRNNFHLLYKKIFDGMIKGVKISLSAANRDPKRVEIWLNVATNVQKMVHICKTLNTKTNILIFLRCMPILLRLFLNSGIPILEHNLKYQSEDITKLVKLMQVGTRYLHAVCCDGMEKKDMILTKHIPAAKSVLERLVYSVKGMLVLNNSSTAFWMGNLLNKNLEGQEILSQTSSEETSLPSIDTITHEASNISSEILDSDSNEEEKSMENMEDDEEL